MTDGISRNAIKQLALKGSVGSLSAPVYDKVRSEIKEVVKLIASAANTICKTRSAKTINNTDVQMAISTVPYLQYMEVKKRKKKQRNVKSCSSIATNTYGMKKRDKITKKRIKKSKAGFNCFNLPKATVKRLVSGHTDCNKTNDALVILQESVETHIINIFFYASKMTENKIMKVTTVEDAIDLVKAQRGMTEERHKERLESYVRRTHKIHRQETSGISNEAVCQIDTILNLVANKLASLAVKLCRLSKRSTVTANHVSVAVKLLTGDTQIGKALKRQIILKVDLYKNNNVTYKKQAVFTTTRCGRFISTPNTIRTSTLAKVAITAVIEWLCEEMIDTSDPVAHAKKKLTVSSRHVFVALDSDTELNALMKTIGYKIPLAGVTNRAGP